MLPLSRARELIAKFSKQRIFILGDMMLDRYVHGEVERISQEAPVPVIRVQRDSTVPGGACNVACNVTALGGNAFLCGIVGEDIYGEELIERLNGLNVNTRHVLVSPRVSTVVKTRVIAEQQQVCRVDREALDHEVASESPTFLSLLDAAMQQATGAIIEDYGKGAVKQSSVDRLLQNAHTRHIPTGYDPKENHILQVSGITFATPNRKEAFHMSGIPEKSPEEPPLEDASLQQVGATLQHLWNPNLLMVTLGPHGMMLFPKNEPPRHVPTRAREVFDVSGAGDTVIATCMLALAAGANYGEAAELANYAAGLVVAKHGTATCTPEELLENMSRNRE